MATKQVNSLKAYIPMVGLLAVIVGTAISDHYQVEANKKMIEQYIERDESEMLELKMEIRAGNQDHCPVYRCKSHEDRIHRLEEREDNITKYLQGRFDWRGKNGNTGTK